ncbi:MDR family oxidoreductase [soil metagenome]
MSFQALYLTKNESGIHSEIATLDETALPPGDVLIRVSHSTLNYKDALAITGRAPVIRSFPMVPGIDLAGMVEESTDPRFAPGDAVLVNGWGIGEERWGGLAEKARVPGEFVIKIPEGFGPEEAMALGTAGYTAMLCLMELERGGVKPADGKVLVTGATGGVGSVAISILKANGFEVTASTGKTANAAYLQALGAVEVIDRAELSSPGKPLQKERWAAAIDSVGGYTLANVCASLRYRGHVAACGLAQSMDFPASVAPFILRNITLHGIDSVRAPSAERELAWQRLSREFKTSLLDDIVTTIPLAEAATKAAELLTG